VLRNNSNRAKSCCVSGSVPVTVDLPNPFVACESRFVHFKFAYFYWRAFNMSRRLLGSLYRRTSRRQSQQSRWSLRPVSAFESLEDRLLLSASCVVSCAATVCQSSKCAPTVCSTGPCSPPTCSTNCSPRGGNTTECELQAIAACFSTFSKCDPCSNTCSSQCRPASNCDPCGDRSESCGNNDSCSSGCSTKCDPCAGDSAPTCTKQAA
jgi:hypothetical protein